MDYFEFVKGNKQAISNRNNCLKGKRLLDSSPEAVLALVRE